MDDLTAEPSKDNGPGGAPSEITHSSTAEPAITYASFFGRFTAYFLDNLLLLVITFIIVVFSIKVTGPKMESLEQFGAFFWLICTFYAMASVGYFTIMTGYGGMTIGKRLVGVKVVAVDGSEITYEKAFVRCTACFVSAFFLCIGFLLALVDSRHQTFHDKIAGTVVVEIE